MVHFCAVPGCSNRSDRDSHLSFHRSPLQRKKLLKQWIHKIGRKNLPLTKWTRVCSEHFAKDRLPRADDVPSLKLPELSTSTTASRPRQPLLLHPLQSTERDLSSSEQPASDTELESNSDSDEKSDVGVNTDITTCDMKSMEVMKLRHKELESKYEKQLFRVENNYT